MRVSGSVAMNEAHVVDIACGSGHSLAISDVGDLYMWGRGTSGQLGFGKFKIEVQSNGRKQKGGGSSEEDEDEDEEEEGSEAAVNSGGASKQPVVDVGNENLKPTKVKMKGGQEPRTVAGGDEHSMLITHSGLLYAFGSNRDGQLGIGRPEEGGCYIQITPTPVVGAISKNKVAQVSCGSSHSAAVTENGVLYTWGETFNGRCGYSSAGTNMFVPTLVPDFSYIECARVSCGGYHTCVLTVDQRVYVFGQPDARLGIGDR